jgi:hypothetical protein
MKHPEISRLNQRNNIHFLFYYAAKFWVARQTELRGRSLSSGGRGFSRQQVQVDRPSRPRQVCLSSPIFKRFPHTALRLARMSNVPHPATNCCLSSDRAKCMHRALLSLTSRPRSFTSGLISTLWRPARSRCSSQAFQHARADTVIHFATAESLTATTLETLNP